MNSKITESFESEFKVTGRYVDVNALVKLAGIVDKFSANDLREVRSSYELKFENKGTKKEIKIHDAETIKEVMEGQDIRHLRSIYFTNYDWDNDRKLSITYYSFSRAIHVSIKDDEAKGIQIEREIHRVLYVRTWNEFLSGFRGMLIAQLIIFSFLMLLLFIGTTFFNLRSTVSIISLSLGVYALASVASLAVSEGMERLYPEIVIDNGTQRSGRILRHDAKSLLVGFLTIITIPVAINIFTK